MSTLLESPMQLHLEAAMTRPADPPAPTHEEWQRKQWERFLSRVLTAANETDAYPSMRIDYAEMLMLSALAKDALSRESPAPREAEYHSGCNNLTPDGLERTVQHFYALHPSAPEASVPVEALRAKVRELRRLLDQVALMGPDYRATVAVIDELEALLARPEGDRT